MSGRKATRKGENYTPEEENFIKENWRKMTDKEMADELGRTLEGVKCHRLKLGLKKWEKTNWSRKKVIRELKGLAENLGRSPMAADDPKLAGAACRYFGSWNATKEAAGLETFRPPLEPARSKYNHKKGA